MLLGEKNSGIFPGGYRPKGKKVVSAARKNAREYNHFGLRVRNLNTTRKKKKKRIEVTEETPNE